MLGIRGHLLKNDSEKNSFEVRAYVVAHNNHNATCYAVEIWHTPYMDIISIFLCNFINVPIKLFFIDFFCSSGQTKINEKRDRNYWKTFFIIQASSFL